MLKRKKKDNEFEKSKKEFLEYMKVNNAQSSSAVVYDVKTYDARGLNSRAYDDNQFDYKGIDTDNTENKSAWEYELKQHRRRKLLARFHTFGAVCGILSLAIVIILEYDNIIKLIMNR